MRQQLFLFLVFSVFFFGVIAQEFPVQCKGETPDFLKHQMDMPLVPRDIEFYFKNRKSNEEGKAHLLNLVYKSGRILFGDPISTWCQEEFRVLKERFPELVPHKEIYVIKSAKPSVFSGENKLFITTGFIAQFPDPYALSYFIIREGIQQNDAYPREKYEKINTIDECILALAKHSSESDSIADISAGQAYHDIGFKGTSAVDAITLIERKGNAFAQIRVPLSYYKSDLMFVPNNFHEPWKNKSRISFGKVSVQNLIQRQFNERRSNLKKMLKPSKKLWTVRKDLETFEEAQRLARHQVILDQFMNYEPRKALYSIFLCQRIYGQSKWLWRMEAHAWKNILSKDIKSRWQLYAPPTVNGNSLPSEIFLQTLQQLGQEGILAFALRKTEDLRKEHSEIALEVELLQNNMIDMIVWSGRYNIDRYYPMDFKTISENLKNVDTSKFYLMGISDWMRDSSFYRHIEEKLSFQKFGINKVNWMTPKAAHFKGSEVNQDKTNKRNEKLPAMVIELDSLEMKRKTHLLPFKEPDYNELAIFKAIQYEALVYDFTHLEYVGSYHENIKGLSADYSSNHLAWITLKNKYSLNLKGYHILGLMVIPLPIVLPEYFIGGHKTQFNGLVLNLKMGTIHSNYNERSKNPANTRFIKSKLYNFFQEL